MLIHLRQLLSLKMEKGYQEVSDKKKKVYVQIKESVYFWSCGDARKKTNK